jgi:broad specificity phosphatase PhoE
MRTLIMARHGESEYSAAGRCSGDPTIPIHLTPKGREQAEALAHALVDQEIDLCVTSEFPRTNETADLALAGRAIPRLELPEFNDIRYGSLEGESVDTYHEWKQDHTTADRLPDGESRVDVAARAAAGLRRLQRVPEDTVLLVSHEIVIALICLAAENQSPEEHGPDVQYATPYPLPVETVDRAAGNLERWVADQAD